MSLMTYDTINDAVTMAGGGGALLAGRYRVVRQLGQGGMGSVWLAEDTQLDGKLFAIKMLPSILVSNKRAYRQLKDEALVAMQLVHPNIVQIRAFEENNGNPFLVMDYVDGETLDDYLAEHCDDVNHVEHVERVERGSGGLPEDEAIRILKPIAAALDYAHGEGVVHRDVKPANVMIRKDGHPYILDFGIAREIQETMTRVTGKLSSGTLLYMSPEQLHGAAPKKEQDIYSFAAMAYECLKGEPPFSRGQIEYQIDNDTPEPLAGVGAMLARSVMAGLAKKPEDRPATCLDVLSGDVLTQSSREAGKQRKAVGQDSSNASQEECRTSESSLSSMDGKPVRDPWMLVFLIMLAVANFYIWRMHILDIWPEWTGQDVPTIHGGGSSLPGPRQKSDAAAKAAASEIRSEALDLKSRVEEISDLDGFMARKCTLADLFARADELFDERTRQWSEAARLFTNYVNECRALVVFDGERRAASRNRKVAQDAFMSAETSGAKIYARDSWNAAVSEWNSAADAFGRMDFTMAAKGFEVAQEGFLKSGLEARNKKREDEGSRTGMRRAGDVNDDLYALLSDLEADKRKSHGASTRERWRREGEQFMINEPNGLNMTMKWCPPGSFMMGSPISEEGRDDDERQHRVTLTKGFWMGETEVTQGQWKKIMDGETVVDLARKGLQDDTKYNLAGKQQTLREFWGMERYGDPNNRCGELKDDVAVYNVTWNEAVEFCRKLTQRERNAGCVPDGYEYRLPTEAEWEYACRAGTTTALPTGMDIRILGENNAPALDDIAWYGGNSSICFPQNERAVDTSGWKRKQYPFGRAFAREVKGKRANGWGLYDMIGNIREWCGDWHGTYTYGGVVDPVGPTIGAYRVNRGGGWTFAARGCRSAFRGKDSPDIRNYDMGFRVALAPRH